MLNLADYKLIIFDLDGTITHNIHDFDLIKRELNLPQNQDILTSLHDLDLEERLRTEQKLQKIELDLARQSVLQTGIKELLIQLIRNQTKIAVLTRNTRINAITTLKACDIFELFDSKSILGREDSLPKPNPAGIQQLMKYFGINKSETAIIGDYKYDLICGRNAGITSIYFDPENQYLWNDLADFRIKNYTLKLITNKAAI